MRKKVKEQRAARLTAPDLMAGQLVNERSKVAQLQVQQISGLNVQRVVAFQAEMLKRYGIDFTAGDDIDMESGEIKWHTAK